MTVQPDEILDKIRRGDRRLLARAISLIENRADEGTALLKAAFPFVGKAVVVGLTGAPGAGKSSLVDHLTAHLRKENKTLAIVAVDPSSPFTGGAILGDRVRMQRHATDPSIFIRSMATRGNLGGLAGTTVDVVALLDAAGFDYILVETVGVGQDEVDIVRTAHISIVILVPGMGDDIQAIKAGIMEIGDIFVINKADRDGAAKTEQEIRAILSLNHRADGWDPPVLKTVAIRDEGLSELRSSILDMENFLARDKAQGRFYDRAVKEKLLQMARDRLFYDFLNETDFAGKIEEFSKKITEKSVDPYTIIEKLIQEYKQRGATVCSKK